MKNTTLRVVDLVTTDEDRKFEPAARMASAILDLLQRRNDCRPHDLTAVGFSSDEVSAHWHLAHSLASVELALMSGEE